MKGWLSLSAKLLGNRVLSIPSSDILIALAGHHDSSHDGADVEVGPCEHFVHDGVHCEVLSSFLHSFFHWDSPLVIDRFWLISIIVGLH